MPFNIQGPELILILIIALIVIGPGKLPDVGAALGRSIREFRKAATDVKDATSLEPKTSTPPVPVARVETPPVVTPASEPTEAQVPGAPTSRPEEPPA
jgi:TatA/E family protein of Tat protein translocase